MTTKTNTFSFAGLELRSVTIDGKPWFIAADVCRLLGLSLTAGATHHLGNLDKAEKQTLGSFEGNPSTGRGNPRRAAITESGLYKLVMRAQKANPKAAEFQSWVTGTVLPAIRQDGMYVQGEEKLDPNNDADLDQLVLSVMTKLQAKAERLAAENKVMKDELTFLTVDEYRALMHAYWDHSGAH